MDATRGFVFLKLLLTGAIVKFKFKLKRHRSMHCTALHHATITKRPLNFRRLFDQNIFIKKQSNRTQFIYAGQL